MPFICHSYFRVELETATRTSDSERLRQPAARCSPPQKTIETFRYAKRNVFGGAQKVVGACALSPLSLSCSAVKTRYHNIGNLQWDAGRFEERERAPSAEDRNLRKTQNTNAVVLRKPGSPALIFISAGVAHKFDA